MLEASFKVFDSVRMGTLLLPNDPLSSTVLSGQAATRRRPCGALPAHPLQGLLDRWAGGGLCNPIHWAVGGDQAVAQGITGKVLGLRA